MEVETYYADVTCQNCNKRFELSIQKGRTIEDYITNTDCPHCGCKLKTLPGIDLPIVWPLDTTWIPSIPCTTDWRSSTYAGTYGGKLTNLETGESWVV